MNRGIARRAVFEDRADVRAFVVALARTARSRALELHAFCIMITHFHLLVRSPVGELSSAMQRVQNEYVRWFNRRRRRDGPLFRGRFRSRRLFGDASRCTALRYIDFNPVDARIVQAPAEYPHGSAWHYARSGGPPWLDRSWVEALVTECMQSKSYDPRLYAELFDEPVARIAIRPGNTVELPSRVRRWLEQKARLADGTS